MERDVCNIHYRSMGYDYATETALRDINDPATNSNPHYGHESMWEKAHNGKAMLAGKDLAKYSEFDWTTMEANPKTWNHVNTSDTRGELINPAICMPWSDEDYYVQMSPDNPQYSVYSKADDVHAIVMDPQNNLYNSLTRGYLDAMRGAEYSFGNYINGHPHFEDTSQDDYEDQET